jgi:hypothetical protein
MSSDRRGVPSITPLRRSGVGTVAWGQSPMPDPLQLGMRLSAGVWRGGFHLLSVAAGEEKILS